MFKFKGYIFTSALFGFLLFFSVSVFAELSTGEAVGCAIAGGIVGGLISWTGVGLLFSGLAGAATMNFCNSFFEDDKSSFNKIFSFFTSSNEGCWFCPVFRALFDAINTISTTLYNSLQSDMIRLLGLGLLFFILFKVLKAVMSFSEINPKEFFMGLFMPLIKAMMALVVLANITSFYHYVVNPLTELSIGFASIINSNQTTILSQALNVTTNSSGVPSQSDLCQVSSSSSSSDDQMLFKNDFYWYNHVFSCCDHFYC